MQQIAHILRICCNFLEICSSLKEFLISSIMAIKKYFYKSLQFYSPNKPTIFIEVVSLPFQFVPFLAGLRLPAGEWYPNRVVVHGPGRQGAVKTPPLPGDDCQQSTRRQALP